jgi:hypothetical protein
MIRRLRRWLRWQMTQAAHRRHAIDWVGFVSLLVIAVPVLLIGIMTIYRHATMLAQLG